MARDKVFISYSQRDGSRIEIQNLTDYSVRPQSLAVTAEADVERAVHAGDQVELPLQPGMALTLTTGVDSGRQQLVRLGLEARSTR